MNTVKCLASPSMTTIVINNLPKYVAFKDPKFDSSFLLGDHIHLNHTITVRHCNTASKLVIFLCVPPSIGDYMIIHLIQHFGTITDTNVTHKIHKDNIGKGLPNGNRSVEVELFTGIDMPTSG